jgi:hypothetical protein
VSEVTLSAAKASTEVISRAAPLAIIDGALLVPRNLIIAFSFAVSGFGCSRGNCNLKQSIFVLVSHKDRDYPHSIVFCEPSPESRHPRTGKIDRNALDK